MNARPRSWRRSDLLRTTTPELVGSVSGTLEAALVRSASALPWAYLRKVVSEGLVGAYDPDHRAPRSWLCAGAVRPG